MTRVYRYLTTDYKVEISPATGREIKINPSLTKFLIVPEPNSIKRAYRRIRAMLDDIVAEHGRSQAYLSLTLDKHTMTVVETHYKDNDQIVSRLDEAIGAVIEWRREIKTKIKDKTASSIENRRSAGEMVCFMKFIAILRDEEVLAWPSYRNLLCTEEDGRHRSEHTVISGFFLGALKPLLDQTETYIRSRDHHASVRVIYEWIFSRLGITCFADLSENVLGDDLRKGKAAAGYYGLKAHDALNAFYKTEGHPELCFPTAKYSRIGQDKITDGIDEVTYLFPTMAQWVEIAKEFVGQSTGQKKTMLSGLRSLLQQIAERGPDFHDPRFVFRNAERLSDLNITNSHYKKLYRGFFKFAMESRSVSEILPDGRVAVEAGFSNPIDRIGAVSNSTAAIESMTPALPTWLMHQMKQVLVEDNFRFGRTLHVKGIVPAIDRHIQLDGRPIFCPVRSIYMLLKLTLPVRGHQLRCLDSGEGDDRRYEVDPEVVERAVFEQTFPDELRKGKWAINNGQLARRIRHSRKILGQRVLGQGTLTQRVDNEGAPFLGLYINTNKTADQGKIGNEAGYHIPWVSSEAVAYILYMRNWWETNAPLEVLTSWSDITERYFKQMDRFYLAGRPDTAFLFRQPRSSIGAPLQMHQIEYFWDALMAEMQARLQKQGITGIDGQEIKLGEFVERKSAGNKTDVADRTVFRPYYTLHSIRHGLITALVQDERIPVEIVMKLVGHASMVMTLWYTKFSDRHFRDAMENAAPALKGQMDDFLASLAELDDGTRERLIFNSPNGYAYLKDYPKASHTITDLGVCPNGAQMCHVGGIEVKDDGESAREGGSPKYKSLRPMNCVRCRFLVTGPAYLHNLINYFHQVGWALREKSVALNKQFDACDRLEHGTDEVRRQGREVAAKMNALRVATERRQALEHEIRDIVDDWSATFRLIEDCIAIARKRALGDSEKALLLVNDFASFTDSLVSVDSGETTVLELADWICQAAEVMQSNVLTEVLSAASAERLKHLDRILKRQGIDPVFFDLDEEVARGVANEMAYRLYHELGRQDANRIAAGNATLKDLRMERAQRGLDDRPILAVETLLRQVGQNPKVLLEGPPPSEFGSAAMKRLELPRPKLQTTESRKRS